MKLLTFAYIHSVLCLLLQALEKIEVKNSNSKVHSVLFHSLICLWNLPSLWSVCSYMHTYTYMYVHAYVHSVHMHPSTTHYYILS